MPYFVYIIYSDSSGIYYKGYTSNPEKRLEEHNSGLSKFTCNKGPWVMVYLEECFSKSQALKREKSLKRYNHEYIKILIDSPNNLVNFKNDE